MVSGRCLQQDCSSYLGIVIPYVQNLGNLGDYVCNLLILLSFLGVTLLPNHR